MKKYSNVINIYFRLKKSEHSLFGDNHIFKSIKDLVLSCDIEEIASEEIIPIRESIEQTDDDEGSCLVEHYSNMELVDCED